MNRRISLIFAALVAVSSSVFAKTPVAPNAAQKSSEELRLLHVAPITGNLKATGNWLNQAIVAYSQEVQKNGDVPFKITVKTVDDGYVAEKTLALAKQEVKAFHPHALVAVVGTANVKALIDKQFFDEFSGPIVGTRSGAPVYHKNLVHLRASNASEVAQLMELAQIQGFDSVGVLYQDDDFGKDGLLAAQQYVSKNQKMHLVSSASYPRNTAEVAAAFDTIQKASPKAVIMISNTNATAAFVTMTRDATAKTGKKMTLMTLSATDAGQVVEKTGNKAQGLVVAQIVPSLYDPRFVVAADFLKFSERNKLPPNPTVFEGYLIARVTIDAAKRIKGVLTPESLLAELRSKPISVGGLRFNLPNQERPSTFVDTLIVGSGNQLYY